MSQAIALPSDWQDSFTITPTGLTWNLDQPTVGHIVAVGYHLLDLGSAYMWSWADLLVKAIDFDGTKAGQAYPLVAGIHPGNPTEKTLQNHTVTARRWSPDRRRMGRGAYYSHHEALNPLTDAEQDRLLDLSQQRYLSVTALRALRFELYPQYGQSNGGNPVQQQVEDTQIENDRLYDELHQAKQRQVELESQVRGLQATLVENGLDMPPVDVERPERALVRQYAGSLLPQGELVTLPVEPGGDYVVFFVDGRLGSVRKGGDYIEWREKDDPVSRYLWWMLVARGLGK